MASCSASFCKNTSFNSKARFFRFPRVSERRIIWTQYCRNHQSWSAQEHHRLCDQHFENDQYESNRADNKKKLKQNAVPNVVPTSNVSAETPADVAHVAERQQDFMCGESNNANSTRSDHSYGIINSCPRKRKKSSQEGDVTATQSKSYTTNESTLENVFLDETSLNDFLANAVMDASEPVSDSHGNDYMNTIHNLQLELRQLRRKLQLSESHLANLKANLTTFLRDDQIEKLQMKNGSSSRCSEWSTETIQHALSIRAAVGRNGYEHLRTLGYPLPSYRTLCRRLESAPFAPGIQSDVIEWLKCKLANRKDHHRECVLLVDEMQLKQRVEYDKGLRRLVGYVSSEAMTPASVKADCKEMASHALVFMVRGLAVSWKQTVAYLYSGNKLDRDVFWSFMTKVISAVEIAGLRVRAVTSDMGPINLGLWNHVGVRSTRDEVVPAVNHPSSADRLLYFIADPPHLLKNLWNCLLTNQITVGPSTVMKYNLLSPVVDCKHVKSLISLQSGRALRLAYKLRNAHIQPSQYEKMRVPLAAQFYSRSTAAAIETCVHNELLPKDALTTAWFIRFVNEWFDVMNARHKAEGLFLSSAHGWSVLNGMLLLIQDLSFNGRKIWKPIQTGIQLSTTVVLKLGNDFMIDHKLQYFLTGRLSQDPVENLFSQARGNGVSHPSCLIFRQTLRLITIAQFLNVPKSAAYDNDGCNYLINYLKDRPTIAHPESELSSDCTVALAVNECNSSDNNCDTSDNNCDDAMNDSTVIHTDDVDDVGDSYYSDNVTDVHDHMQSVDQCVPAQINDCDNDISFTDNPDMLPADIGFQDVLDLDVLESCDIDCIDGHLHFFNSVEPREVTVQASSPRPVEKSNSRIIGCLESTALHDITGWALSKALAGVTCSVCREAFVLSVPTDSDYSLYTSSRSHGGLVHPTPKMLDAMMWLESIFLCHHKTIHVTSNLLETITQEALDVIDTVNFKFPECHGVLSKVIRKYICLRIHSFGASTTQAMAAKRQFGSKTACRNTMIL